MKRFNEFLNELEKVEAAALLKDLIVLVNSKERENILLALDVAKRHRVKFGNRKFRRIFVGIEYLNS